jgi:predicted hydrolase (HD superfamily)
MREKALALLIEYNKGANRITHALLIEAMMRHFAALKGEDVDYWGAVGLLHDLDFEAAPGHHCKKNPEMLSAAGYDQAFIHSVQSHGYGLNTNVEPILWMEKILYVQNELATLILDSALFSPSHSVLDLNVEDVEARFPEKGFSPGANRDVILKGCRNLDMSFADITMETILGMRANAAALGLMGDL